MEQKVSDQTTRATVAESPEQPLGRGLEQISHLFLSRKPAGVKAEGPRAMPLPESTTPAPAAQSLNRALYLQQATATRARLASVLKDAPDTLEQGLRILDVSVPCHPFGEIDTLGLDRTNQLTIVEFETATEPALLRGLAHCDWVVSNLPNVLRMYPQALIAPSARPRLVLLVPKSSPVIESAARQLADLQVRWIRYQLFETGRGLGIFLGPIETRDY